MSKKRILIVTELYPYPGNVYLGTFIAQQLRELNKYFDITVLTIAPKPIKTFFFKQPRLLIREDAGIKVVAVPFYPFVILVLRAFQIPNSVLNYVKKILLRNRIYNTAKYLHVQNKFDIVHGHETYIGDEAGPIGQKLQIPSVFTLHSFYFYHRQLFGKFAVGLALNNLRLCDRYIAVSTIAADSYIKVGLRRERFSIIPNGVNIPPPTQPNQQMLDFARGRRVLLSVGWLIADKQLDCSVRTLAQLPATETVLVIVGIGPEKGRLEHLATSLNCHDRILWLGAIEPKLMPAVYEASDILIHPSLIESFSMVCLEAMAQGRVVICTTAIGICEFTKNGENIVMVPPKDVAAVVAAVKSLLARPEEYQRLARNAAVFGATMTWAQQVEKIRFVYAQVVSNQA